MTGSCRSSNTGKTLLRSVTQSVKSGNAAEVIDQVEKWAIGEEVPLPEWDVILGASLWNRCVDQDKVTSEEEVRVLEKINGCLIKTFIRESHDTANYVERIRVFGATLKFFVQHKRLNLEVIEELLHEIAKTSYHVRQKDYASFKTVCLNFYAIIWNYMRENQEKFDLMQSLTHASLSMRWLVVLGLDQFQNISHKLAQIGFLLVKRQPNSTGTIVDFFYDLSFKIVDLMKQVVVDDSKNGIKVKKIKTVLPALHFFGFLNISFLLTRQLVLLGDFDKALKIFRPVTSVAKVYFDQELTELWKKVLEAYVKMSMVVTIGVSKTTTEDASKIFESFRKCRKQILDVQFQKNFPGYAFCFMYAFTDCIGYAITNSKSINTSKTTSVSSTPLYKQLPLGALVKFLKEIRIVAGACAALGTSEIGKNVLEGISETRKVEVGSTALFHVMKFATERITDKEMEIDKELQQITEGCFETLMLIAGKPELESARSADLYSHITLQTCNIGYGYQKRKDYREAMSWCYRSIDAYEMFRKKGVNIEIRCNILSIGLLLADCHRQLDNHLEGIRWLSKWLVIAPQYVDAQSTAYDIYEQIPWTDWAVHWQALQKEICGKNPDNCRTVVDYMEENDPTSTSDMFASKVLRLELNAYFSGRQTVVPGMLRVGQQLVENNFSISDKILGLVSQAAGLWWISTEEALCCAIKLLNEAVESLGKTHLVRGSTSKGGDEALRIYLSGIMVGWRAMCIWKMKQCITEGQLDALKEKLVLDNPEKLKDKSEGSYAVPGFTNLTIEDEVEWANNLIHSAECFYQLAQMEDIFKSLTDVLCPALAQITVRLVALGLSALGDKVNSVKAWYATFVVAKLYDRKGLVVLAASEVLKVLPCPTLECVQYAEKVNKDACKANLIKHNKAVYYRLDLAKAIAYHQTKNYEEGLKHLIVVYNFLSQKDNFDSTHHLMAEADYVLSLYRSAALNKNVVLPSDLPEMLCKMTPAGLAVKGYKLLGGLSRETDIPTSGWTDLLHNYYLLGSVSEISSRTLKLLKETGKLRDLKCFITDAVYFMQRIGIVSRSVSILIPLIEMDVSARNFHMAQIRIAAVSRVLMAGSYKANEDAPSFEEAKRFLENHLKIPGLSISRLENVSNLKWHLGDIEEASFHYRNRSSKYLSSLKKDCESIAIKSMEMRAPSFLRHHLTCACYTCVHLEIVPSALEFLVAQTKYAVTMKWKISMAVLELTRLHHQRAMFRILFNMDSFTEQLQPIVARKTGSKLLHTVYSNFFFKPGFQMQLANMEITPICDTAHIVHLMNVALGAAEIYDSHDYVLKAFALEIGTSALYESFFSSGKIPILDGNIRDLLRVRVNQQEKENTLSNTSPKFAELSSPQVAPPLIRKRGVAESLTQQQRHGRKATVTSLRPRRILNNNNKSGQQELSACVELVDLTKADGIDEERHLPVIPPPNFDDSNDD
ncbi:hypothetical protein Ocin01_01584 [Orchesella cincta]|uniref:Uncharacterized protein n=1 Tax=Orchesella cincta TaxID=48709 RepID=A0A1D2NII8_ORCCI|nr:hypothetical protein Ocin01_01584 [Orchesella cincta]